MFDFDMLEKLSGLDGKQMKKDIVMCVDERKFMLPMIYINYRALGISMHMYLVRMFQNVPSYRKAEIVDEFSLMPASELLYDSEAEFEYRKLAERVFHSRKGTGTDNEDWYYGWYI